MVAGKTLALTPEKQQRLLAADVQPQEIVLGIRPEHVEPLQQTSDFAGVVEVTEMMGSSTHLHVRFGEDRIVIMVPEGEETDLYRRGDSISFTFQADRMHLFSRETEENLEFLPAKTTV